MDTGKQGDIAIIIYMFLLLAFDLFNMITNFDVLDLVYFLIVIYGILKFLRGK